MKYDFPHIAHIDDVLRHIKGVEGIVVAEREDYTVINYLLSNDEVFPPIHDDMTEDELLTAAIRRECRGLIFNKDGRLISRPYHKFFNIGERAETQPHLIDFSYCIFLEKLDGSMIRPIPIGDSFRLGTRMGITDVSMQAEVFIERPENELYKTFITQAINANCTPIFEWCSNKQKIVIDHPKDRLVLTGIRHNYSGKYIDLRNFISYQWHFPNLWSDYLHKNIESVKEADRDVVKNHKEVENEEGWIAKIGPDYNHMAKIKTEWYVLRHHSKDAIMREKNVISMIVSGDIDDVKSFLIQEDAQKISDFEISFYICLFGYATDLLNSIQEAISKVENKKQFALEQAILFEKHERSVAFRCYDQDSLDVDFVVNELLKIIEKNCSSQTGVDSVRHMWKGLRWENWRDQTND